MLEESSAGCCGKSPEWLLQWYVTKVIFLVTSLRRAGPKFEWEAHLLFRPRLRTARAGAAMAPGPEDQPVRLRATRVLTLVSFSLLILLASAPALWANEFSSGIRLLSSADLDGFRGNQGIRTSPATVVGVGYFHPTQMDVGSQGASFVAIGTYNGSGTSGHDQDCPNDYDSGWSGYYDGSIAGVYFCRKFADDVWAVGDAPKFRIQRDCQLGGGTGWGVYFGGSQRACLDSNASGAIGAVAALETLTSDTTDRNIDVKYTSLEVNFKGGTTWWSFNRTHERVDPNYSRTDVSATAFNTYLAPLD